jgi:hypothetical protein
MEELDIDGRMVLKWILREMGCKSVDLIHLVQDMACGRFL